MWHDNETEIDLLGFEYLVDSLELVLRETQLLPVTVGVMGDWGSGKSSLMTMAGLRLKETAGFVVVPFSPWKFEGYDDVKTALMAAVLDALTIRAQADEDRWARTKGHLAGLAEDLRTLSRLGAAAGALGALAVGLPADAGATVGGAASEAVAASIDAATRNGDEVEPAAYRSASDFRTHFRALLNEMDDVQALVVCVDDLDRCLPETIVATFEAIRLFLHVPKTAYVLAAHPLIVEAAVAARYAGNREGDADLGRDYLEKIVQVSITVPPLAEPEVESYINLLFADLHLNDEQFARVRARASERRAKQQLAVAMNYAAAAEVLGEVPVELQRSFELANRIGPTLARGLRGNPRQVKRFLNTFTLRRRTAELRGVRLDPGVLAKLMILELSLPEFERLFQWQLAQDGQPNELAQAEQIAREGRTPDGTSDTVKNWAAQPEVSAWLHLEPPLAGVPLGSYFFFSRDRLSPAAPASRLSGALQDLLGRLQEAIAARRRAAIDEAVALDPTEAAALYGALLERAVRDPRGKAMDSAIEWAGRTPHLAPALAGTLASIPPAGVPVNLPPNLAVAFRVMPAELAAVLRAWEDKGRKGLREAVRDARGER